MNLYKSTLVATYIAAAVLAAAAEPAAANGATSLVTCGGTAEQTYDPGLTLATRDTHIAADNMFGTCVDLSGGPTPVTSAFIKVDYIAPASCLLAPPRAHVTVNIEWSGNQHSTAVTTVVVTRSTGTTLVATTGTITSGPFAGSGLLVQVTYPSLDGVPDCLLGEGVTHVSGIAALAVSPH